MIKNYVFFCGLIISAAAGPTEYFPIKLGQAYVVSIDCPHDWNRVITFAKGISQGTNPLCPHIFRWAWAVLINFPSFWPRHHNFPIKLEQAFMLEIICPPIKKGFSLEYVGTNPHCPHIFRRAWAALINFPSFWPRHHQSPMKHIREA